ncbi:hypothetical protein NBE99_05760 [Thermosynechococcus sp. HN-54]|uniref:DUF6671 family protein n=1 Tax=Thermosynechococcus sp. HN-54 TaxID=2933959 RepID=UPI00202CF451|nr:DUF6671 family protein [Thermosynechococcus sp. HN-54]URR36639.1 hypothetical protein NBE99_05760 [Thermosynechococcus sp. HN-54]
MFKATDSYFQGRTAILATKHGKEQVIAPALAPLGVTVVVANDFDSDRFGTFSREIPRCGTQEEAALAKAEAVLAQTEAELVLASEGSFGPHPQFPMLPSDRELVLLLDRRHNLTLWGEVISLETNFNHATVGNLEEALAFAARVGFPDHALIAMVSAEPPANTPIFKGLQTEEQLAQAIATLQTYRPTIHLETDMRAHMNPTRMRVIAEAAAQLVQAMTQGCPQCGWPGFVAREKLPGLPCELCGAPTSAIKASRYRCQRCLHQLTLPVPETVADASQCYFCNP